MSTLQKVALVFTIIGAIVWLLVGLFDFNLVTSLFGEANIISRIIYIVVGLCGLINIRLIFEED